MASAKTPLLAGSRRSASSDRLADEENAALGYRSTRPQRARPNNGAPSWMPGRLREGLLLTWALLASAAVVVLAVWIHHHRPTSGGRYGASAATSTSTSTSTSLRSGKGGKRNLIFMVSDGMGPASLSLTRSFRQHVEGLPIDDVLTLDRHFWGTSRTRSSNSLVTDSAAGATAFSCGLKSYNGAISTLPDHNPCGTVLEAAKRAGYHTGLVVTTDVTDATPACFASHVDYRLQEDEIAVQEVGEGPLGRVVDIILGGGRCHFLPNTTKGSCRADDIDVSKLAQEKHGWTYLDDRSGFDSLEGGEKADLPVLGLFASTDIPFEIDRRNRPDIFPSLSEMARAALRALEKATADSDKGFFLMIEGSRIDHAGHINDPAAQVREVLEYDRTFQAVLDFIEASDTEGVLVATSDHETGGLATALQEPGHLPVYNWYPEALKRASASAEQLTLLLNERLSSSSSSGDGLRHWINETLVRGGLGIHNVADHELDQLVAHPEDALVIFAEMISLRAHVGWSTHGHSAVDVNIYSSGGPGTEKIQGNVENTDVGRFLAEYLGVENGVKKITKELKESRKAAASGPSWKEKKKNGEEPSGFEAEGLPLSWISPSHM